LVLLFRALAARVGYLVGTHRSEEESALSSFLPPLALVLSLCLAPVACGTKLNPGEVDEADAGGSTGSGDTTGSTGTAAGGGSTTTGGTGTGTTTPTTPTTTSKLCGTDATTIGYAANVQAIISKSCASSSCHGGGRNPKMTDFASSKAGISGGGKDEVESGSMPLGKTLTDNEKCMITQWAEGNYAP
jgi:hypothetical protein